MPRYDAATCSTWAHTAVKVELRSGAKSRTT
jgi:hypothetical protein